VLQRVAGRAMVVSNMLQVAHRYPLRGEPPSAGQWALDLVSCLG
jgi:hypothetical protein